MPTQFKTILFFLIATVGTSAFGQTNALIVGKWQGITHTPWTLDYPIEIEFRADGTYSSKALPLPTLMGDDSAAEDGKVVKKKKELTPALYYGSDGYNKKKKYCIEFDENGLPNGGTITFYFDGTKTAVERPFEFIGIRKKDALNRGKAPHLNFSVFYSIDGQDLTGPIQIMLDKIEDNLSKKK